MLKKKALVISAGIVGIIIIIAAFLLITPNFFQSGYMIDLTKTLNRGDFAIAGLPWLSTLSQAQDLLDEGAVQEMEGKELTLYLDPMKVHGVKSTASGLFYFYLIENEHRLMQITLELQFQKEEKYIAFLKMFKRDMTEAMKVNADLRNEMNTKELDLTQFYKLDQSSSEIWYGAGFQGVGGGTGDYTMRLTAYRADSNLRSIYGENLEILVLLKFRIEPYRKSLNEEQSEDDLVMSLPLLEK